MIRPARIEDAAGIARIHVETWRAAYAGIMPAEFLAGLSVESRTKSWAFALERNALDFFVAEDGGAMAGWCHSTILRGPGSTMLGETRAVYVLPGFQGRGHGAALMSATETDFRGRGVTDGLLWVLEANQPTRRFYERMGYLADGGRTEEVFGATNLSVLRYRKRL
jgi:ribosomal protein S18 acetylase RimI-like enzyme